MGASLFVLSRSTRAYAYEASCWVLCRQPWGGTWRAEREGGCACARSVEEVKRELGCEVREM